MNKWLSSRGILVLLFAQMSTQLSYGQGSSILFYRGEDIYSIKPDGTNLLTVATAVRFPVWSPDGNSIIVTHEPPTNRVDIISPTGSVSASLGGDAVYYSWSPDGQQIVFTRYGYIYLINKDGSGERLLVSSASLVTRWSSNNPLEVYYVQRNPESMDSYDIFRVNVATGVSTLVGARMWMLDIPYPISPDGTRLLMTDCLGEANSCVKVLNLATGERIQIGGKSAQRPAWSPDGTRIAFDSAGGLQLVSSDGQTTTTLVVAQAGAGPEGASWSPTGDRIAFHMAGMDAIYVINTDGTGLRKLTDGSGPVIWSPIRSGAQGDNTNIQTLPWGLLKAQWKQLMYRATFGELALLGNPSSFQN